MKTLGRSLSRRWIGRGAVFGSLALAGACNALVGLDDLEHVLPPATQDSGGACSNPATDCPATGMACKVAACGQDGACGVVNAEVRTPCSEGGGAVCSAEGQCIGCIDDTDCAAPLSCGGGGVAQACGCEPPCHVWSQLFDGKDEVADTSYPSFMAVDRGSGAALVTGWFNGSLQIDKNTLTGNGGQDAFLAKLDPNGGVLWSKNFGDEQDQVGIGVAVDTDGSVLLTGGFKGTLTFTLDPLVSAGGFDVFVAKFTSDGVHLWSRRHATKDLEPDDQNGVRVAIDKLGSAYVVGDFAGNLSFGDSLVSKGNKDVFLSCFNADGLHLWSKAFGGPGVDSVKGVAVDDEGNVLVTGLFNGVADFGDVTPWDAKMGSDIFLIKLDPNGGLMWGKQFGNDAEQYVRSISIDGHGDLLLAGDLDGTLNFGAGNLSSVGLTDAFVLKLKKDGDHIWSKRFGDAKVEHGQAAVDDGSGDVLVTGRFSGTVTFGSESLTSVGGLDSVFFVKLNGITGDPMWARGYGVAGSNYSRALDIDGAGNALLFGYTDGTIDFGGGSLLSAGANSLFLAQFKL
jgi:hypothetical protein